ncbi:hypothetical protein TA3x_005059 [Tundrisphaera sp. TA3]|uniref:hypothetical protein n=1 Tax=Tundrisphaera sp. TA3 TaxID=3435775 RepID=UPI003EB6D78E
MRTLLVVAFSLSLVGCAGSSGVKRSPVPDPSTPRTHKMPTPSQRRSAHQIEATQAVAGRTIVEGALIR